MSKKQTPAIIVPKTAGGQWGLDGTQVVMVITVGKKQQVFPMSNEAVREFCGNGLMAAHQSEKLQKAVRVRPG